MKKSDIAGRVADRIGLSQSVAGNAVDAVFEAVGEALEFETARFRYDDGRERPPGRSPAKIAARRCVTGFLSIQMPAACRKMQNHDRLRTRH